MPRRSIVPEVPLDLGLQLVGQAVPLGQLDKEKYPLVAFPLLSYRQAIGNLFQLLHLVVYFGCPDADPGRLQDSV